MLIAFLCLLLLLGFILVASRLILMKDQRRAAEAEKNAPAVSVEEGPEETTESSEAERVADPAGDDEFNIELEGESLVPVEEAGEPVAEASVSPTRTERAGIDNPSRDRIEEADYDLTEKKTFTITGSMHSVGSAKELLLEEPKSFFGKDATGTKILLEEVEAVRFASSNSSVSIQELRAIPDGTSLLCEGSLYIHDNKVFLRLESLIRQPGGLSEGEVAVG